MRKRKPEQLALIVALVSALAVLLVVLTDLTLSYQRDLESGEKRLQQFSVMMAEHTARSFEAVDLLINEIATDLSSNHTDWNEWSDVRGWEYIAQRHSRAMPQLRDLIVFDAQGRQRFVSTYFPPPQINVSDRPYFITLAEGARRTTFGPYIGRNSGNYSYAIARRLNNTVNRFTGVAFAAIEPAYMQDFCWANRLSDDFDAVLINPRGQIIASCRPTDLSHHSEMLGQSADKALFDGRPERLIPDKGVTRGNGLLIAASPVPGFPELRLIAIIPQEIALSNWTSRLLEIGTLGLLLSLILFFGARLLRGQFVELRNMAEALAENRDQLETRVHEATIALAHEKDTAERANAAKSRFLAAASHDLRQPLHALSLFTTDLLRQAAANRLREVPRIAEQINASTQTLGEMLNALLDISRLDINGIKPEIQTFRLDSLFSRLHDAFHRQAEAKQLRLRFHPTQQLLNTDPRLLERMIGNLLANAIHYTPAGGCVLIGARRQRRKIRIEVRDSGIGITRENQAAIFDEFFQVANSAREQDGGLGLGLSIVERLAHALNIEISLASQIGHGTTFGLLVNRGQTPLPTAANQATTLGRIHFIGTSADLATCKELIETWNYECTIGDILSARQLPDDTVILCDADSTPAFFLKTPLIVLNGSNTDALAKDAHILSLPLRPARLRALLRSTSIRQQNSLSS